MKKVADIMALTKFNHIDIVILNKAKPLLSHRIIHKGKIMKNTDDKLRIALEVRSLQKYIDTKPIRNNQHKYLKQRFMVADHV